MFHAWLADGKEKEERRQIITNLRFTGEYHVDVGGLDVLWEAGSHCSGYETSPVALYYLASIFVRRGKDVHLELLTLLA